MKLSQLFEFAKSDSSNHENDTLKKTPPAGDVPKYVTTAQAARILGVSQSRIRQLIMDNVFKSVESPVKGRRDNLVLQSEVTSYKAKKDANKKDSNKKD